MATTIANAAELIEPLKRAVAGPGAYDAAFPDGDDDTLFAYITDAFGEARLDRFFKDASVDWVTGEFSPAISQGEAALLVIYASINILTTTVRNAGIGSTYKAGTVEYSTSASANVYQQILADMQARKTQLIKRIATGSPIFADAYWGRLTKGYYQTDPGIYAEYLYPYTWPTG